MKYLIILMILSSSQLLFSQNKQIEWLTWDAMVEKRAKDSVKKKVFIDLYTGWCGWCKRMDKTTFLDPNVVNFMNQNYYAVKFDAETTDTINFNGIAFVNSDPTFVKKSPNSRGRTHLFAHSILDGQLSYPSYAILDENYTRVTIIKGYKNSYDLLANLLFFSKDEYKHYHNYLNGIWNKSLKK